MVWLRIVLAVVAFEVIATWVVIALMRRAARRNALQSLVGPPAWKAPPRSRRGGGRRRARGA